MLKLFGGVLCLFKGHERSERRVFQQDEVYYSACRFCGVPMRRKRKREWVVDKNAPRRKR